MCANLLVTIESAGASGGAGAGAGSTAAGQAPALAPADTLLRGLHCVLAPTQSLARTTEAQHKEVFRSLEYILEQLEDESRPKAVLAFIGRWLVHRKFKECPQQVRPSLVCCHTSRCSSSSLSDTSATTLAAASIDFEANLPRGHHPPHPRGRRVSKSYHPGAVRVVLKVQRHATRSQHTAQLADHSTACDGVLHHSAKAAQRFNCTRGVLIVTTLVSVIDYRSFVISAHRIEPGPLSSPGSAGTADALTSEASKQVELAVDAIQQLYQGEERRAPLTLVCLNGRQVLWLGAAEKPTTDPPSTQSQATRTRETPRCSWSSGDMP